MYHVNIEKFAYLIKISSDDSIQNTLTMCTVHHDECIDLQKVIKLSEMGDISDHMHQGVHCSMYTIANIQSI